MTALSTLSTFDWATLTIAALLVGMSKTAIPGAAALPVAIFAAVLPARESTGALLVLLLVADVVAVVSYRAHTDWRALWRLLPAVVVGIIAGSLFLLVAGDVLVSRLIGGVLVGLVALNLVFVRKAVPGTTRRPRTVAGAYGMLGGFTTMVANAGGPVMSMYFLISRFTLAAFLGTAAWFFFIINLIKLPFSLSLGLVTPSTIALNACLIPMVLFGAWLGWAGVRHLSKGVFDAVILVFTGASGLYLLLWP